MANSADSVCTIANGGHAEAHAARPASDLGRGPSLHRLPWERSSPFKPQPIIDGFGQVLPGPQILFGGLDGGVAEQQLDLLEIPARPGAEFGAGAAQVEGRELAERGRPGILDE
jgi:hypothetical protein